MMHPKMMLIIILLGVLLQVGATPTLLTAHSLRRSALSADTFLDPDNKLDYISSQVTSLSAHRLALHDAQDRIIASTMDLPPYTLDTFFRNKCIMNYATLHGLTDAEVDIINTYYQNQPEFYTNISKSQESSQELTVLARALAKLPALYRIPLFYTSRPYHAQSTWPFIHSLREGMEADMSLLLKNEGGIDLNVLPAQRIPPGGSQTTTIVIWSKSGRWIAPLSYDYWRKDICLILGARYSYLGKRNGMYILEEMDEESWDPDSE